MEGNIMSAAESLRLESYEVSREQFPTTSPSKKKIKFIVTERLARSGNLQMNLNFKVNVKYYTEM